MTITRKPRHPGALIKRQYLEPLNLSVTELANVLGVSRKTMSEIVNEHAGITPIMALRLANAFGTTPELWLNLQQKYDLWCAENESEDWKNVAPIDLAAVS
jgi:addiction module HigA family antidote